MADNLDGIRNSTRGEEDSKGEVDLGGVRTLDELLSEILKEEELEGIEVDVEGQEPVRVAQRVRAIAAERQRRRAIEEEQLQELEQIDTTNELLRVTASRLSVIEATLETILNTTQATQSATEANNSLVIKDADEIEISSSSNRRDVVDDEDVLTSFVKVKADATNSGDLYISDSTVGVGNGFKLEAGETERFRVNILEKDFQIVSEDDGDVYTYAAFGPRV